MSFELGIGMGELNGKLKIKEFLMASPLDVKPFPIYWMMLVMLTVSIAGRQYHCIWSSLDKGAGLSDNFSIQQNLLIFSKQPNLLLNGEVIWQACNSSLSQELNALCV